MEIWGLIHFRRLYPESLLCSTRRIRAEACIENPKIMEVSVVIRYQLIF